MKETKTQKAEHAHTSLCAIINIIGILYVWFSGEGILLIKWISSETLFNEFLSLRHFRMKSLQSDDDFTVIL